MPHSGTRTLLEVTGIKFRKHFPLERTWWHFGDHRREISSFYLHAHVPIRHPIAVARSWARRGKKPSDMVEAYEHMFEHADGYDVTWYRMEDYPATKGTGEHQDGSMSNVKEFEEAVTKHVINPNREFFAQYYEDLNEH